MLDMSLLDVRKLLERNDNIYMGENMKFLTFKNHQILFEDEDNYKISKIIDRDNCIHIRKDPSKPSFFQFVNKHSLIRGRYFSPDGMEVKIAQQDAFEFKPRGKIPRLKILNNARLNFYSETCEEEAEKIFAKHFISKANASVFLAPYSFKLGINFEKFYNKKQQASGSYEFTGVKCEKCSATILPDEIEPTKEFKDAVNKALDQETDELRLNEINKLSEKFGDFFPLETEFGGIIQYQMDSNNNISINSKKIQFGSDVQDSTLSYNSESNLSASKSCTNKDYVIIGGDEHECKNLNIENVGNQENWLKSLRDHDKWGLINYSKIVSVYELLEDELKMKLFRVLGQRVLHFDTIEVTFDEKNIMKCKEHEIIIPTDILVNMKKNKETYQIYATILHSKEDICEVFSVHVEYFSLANPYLVIQCIKEGKSERKFECVVKVAWMIVGFPLNFNFKPSLFKLKSYTLTNPSQKFYNHSKYNDHNDENSGQNFSEIFKSHHSRTYCLLETCAFRPNDENEEIASGIVTGCYFCKIDNRSWKPCCYVFDLNEKKQVDFCQIKQLEIYWSIITENPHALVGPEEIEWKKWKKNKDKHTIYKGQEWCKFANEDEQKLIFASFLYDKSDSTDQCSPVFVNINPKYPLMLSFKEQDKTSHISYLVADFENVYKKLS
ncbi:32950_t:CDS:2 [Racocetra persica]|uniref:32950_t:CDS:1 n=1 Tax=Racocetra persica TaxID=160502 RepID=A0ACA9LPS1_9GLOM|nr:32950_t:CDS:2 [Racocetra persica]